jgi:hypothetical protein
MAADLAVSLRDGSGFRGFNETMESFKKNFNKIFPQKGSFQHKIVSKKFGLDSVVSMRPQKRLLQYQ